MWGSNCKEYIQEAYRILESNGTLFIIEPTKRWSEKDEQQNIISGTEACRLHLLTFQTPILQHKKNIKKVIANFTPYYTYLLNGCRE